MVVEACFLLAAAPGLLGVLFLIPHPSNLPLYALCTVSPKDPLYKEALHFCHGYLLGAVEYHEAVTAGPEGKRLFCLPAKEPSRDEALELLRKAPGVVVTDERKPGGYPTAVTEGSGNDPVYVGRVREDISHPRGLNLWVVSDNIRKGAALNSMQIAEVLIKEHL